jgi:LEA14-like dessication related protein
MKRFVLITAVVLILSVLIYYLISRSLILQPEFKEIKDVKLISMTEELAEVEAIAVFFNPNQREARLLNSELKVYAEDIQVASVSQSSMAEIQANSVFEIPIRFKTDLYKLGYSQTISGLLENALNNEHKIKLRFIGYCRLKVSDKVYRIPIEYEDLIVFN